MLPFKPNGKAQHVKGFLKKFAKTAQSSAQFLNQVAETGIPMIGMDASMVLCYRDEYQKTLQGMRGNFTVQLSHEWLLSILPSIDLKVTSKTHQFTLFGHCTEKTALPKSESQWQAIFTHLGLTLTPVAVGCCGMAGTYGS